MPLLHPQVPAAWVKASQLEAANLGVWFTTKLDFTAQHARLTKALRWMLAALKGAPLSPSMLVYAINAAVLPRMLWSLQVALPSPDQLQAWDEMIAAAANWKLSTDGPGHEADSLYLPLPAGLGLQRLGPHKKC